MDSEDRAAARPADSSSNRPHDLEDVIEHAIAPTERPPGTALSDAAQALRRAQDVHTMLPPSRPPPPYAPSLFGSEPPQRRTRPSWQITRDETERRPLDPQGLPRRDPTERARGREATSRETLTIPPSVRERLLRHPPQNVVPPPGSLSEALDYVAASNSSRPAHTVAPEPQQGADMAQLTANRPSNESRQRRVLPRTAHMETPLSILPRLVRYSYLNHLREASNLSRLAAS